MYIVFHLPKGAGGQTAGYALSLIKEEVAQWAQRYDIRYTEKTIKYDHRVAFDHDETYSFFTLTWNPEFKDKYPSWLEYELVNVAGERY
jgi:hypothetical protein